ncbi:alpha/beta fold hydrolase [Flagellimonas sp. 2504JD1-5]
MEQHQISLRKQYPKHTDEDSIFFKWDGMQVHYRDEGNGTPILFLHGTSSSLHTWDGLTTLLKPKYRVIRIDLIGCGLTGPHPKRDYSMEMYLSFIDDFANFLGLHKFIVAGNSWGGMLAWNFAALHPEHISGLILINSAGFKMSKMPTRFKLVKSKAGRWLLKTSMPKWMVEKGLKEVLYSPKIEKSWITRYQALMLRKGNGQAFIDIVRMRQLPKTELLAAIKVPVLLLWGRHDKLYPLKQANLFLERIKTARLEVIEKSAHIPMEEAPSACAKGIDNFINELQKT